MEFLKVNNIKKVYSTRFGGEKVIALDNVSFSVEEGEFISIMGESGSGKTTLLNIIGGLDRQTNGEYLLDGEDMSMIKESKLSDFRRKNLGFVFQDFNLLDTFSLKDNIFLPLVLGREKYAVMEERLKGLSKMLKIEKLLEKYPYEVSGGQKQRCAVGRALITNPKLILADEPTGALDSKSADNLLDIFKKINENGQTILMVTHSIRAASKTNRVLFIKDGKIFHQLYRGSMKDEEMYEKISNSLSLIMKDGE
ncbi:MAG: ABC transporter ATP-binding protein [Clostridium sp.]|uniref:ABC transporter ATP-binding protein n=1 Tax=Clostridium sp. TaxID=1506 RepID=UPI003F314C80